MSDFSLNTTPVPETTASTAARHTAMLEQRLQWLEARATWSASPVYHALMAVILYCTTLLTLQLALPGQQHLVLAALGPVFGYLFAALILPQLRLVLAPGAALVPHRRKKSRRKLHPAERTY